MCCLGLHARLHRDKCNAANLLTSLPYVPGVREIDGADRTTSFDRGSITSSSPAFLNQSFFFSPPFTRVQPLEIVSRFLFHRAEFIAHFKKLPKNFLPSILFIQGGILFLLVISQSCFFFFFFLERGVGGRKARVVSIGEQWNRFVPWREETSVFPWAFFGGRNSAIRGLEA